MRTTEAAASHGNGLGRNFPVSEPRTFPFRANTPRRSVCSQRACTRASARGCGTSLSSQRSSARRSAFVKPRSMRTTQSDALESIALAVSRKTQNPSLLRGERSFLTVFQLHVLHKLAQSTRHAFLNSILTYAKLRGDRFLRHVVELAHHEYSAAWTRKSRDRAVKSLDLLSARHDLFGRESRLQDLKLSRFGQCSDRNHS